MSSRKVHVEDMVVALAVACLLAVLAGGCASVAETGPDGQPTGKSVWTVDLVAMLTLGLSWLWGLLSGGAPPPAGLVEQVWGWVTGHPVESVAIGNAALAAFPNKVQDNVVTAVNPHSGATGVERMLALLAASPLGFFFHSPPPAKKRQTARKAKKTKET